MLLLHRIGNFAHLTAVSLPFLRILYAQRQFKYRRGDTYAFWRTLCSEMPLFEGLPGPLQRRISHYLFANSMTMQWFATLHQLPISRREKRAGWLLATATPLADHLVDKEQAGVEEIELMIRGSSSHAFGPLAQYLYDQAKAANGHPDRFDAYLQATLYAQQSSLQQIDEQPSTAQLKSITWDKGGHALLLFRSALQAPISWQEEEAIKHLGGLLQFHNDLFDLHRDLQENIVTLPSSASTVAELRNLFEAESTKCMELFNRLPGPRSCKRRFYLLLHLALNTGRICLDQYQALEDRDGRFQPQRYTRQELVCDMDQVGKMIRNLWDVLGKRYIVR